MQDDRDPDPSTSDDLPAQTRGVYEQQIAQLRAEKGLMQATLDSIGDAVVTTDATTAATYLNPVAEELLGWRHSDALGKPLAEILRLEHTESGTAVDLELERCLEDGHKLYLGDSFTLTRGDGQRFTIEGNVAAIRDGDGTISGVVVVFQDVSEKQLMSLRLTRAANYDALTGLLNRKAFDHHLQEALDDATESGTSQILCYMDLDQFKVLNDTCGHAAGDQLLQWIASLIRERVRDSDVLARLGGDEFALLLPRCPLATAQRVAEELHGALRNFRFIWQDKNFAVGMSIGLVPVSTEFQDLADLMGAGSHACELAKQKGRRRTQVYQQDDVEIRQHHGQMNWVVRLRQALDENRFRLYWQRIVPISETDDPDLLYEVLLRLEGDGGQIYTPGEFLPVAEGYDLIPAIDRWVVRNTLELLSGQPEQFLRRLECCTLNLSGASLGDGSLLELIEHELARTGFPPRQVCFEITETAAVSNLARAVSMIEQLSARQCRWALDDFGSGMSSYRYLQQLPVHFIKIDGNIVSDMINSPLSRAMVKSINQIGHVKNTRTIAETVTGPAMLADLVEIGVDYAQGFWLERPRPVERREPAPEPAQAVIAKACGGS